jgi:hypothetical protein
MDKQQVEILGRNRLISELVAADLEVSIPLRDRGVDLIAYRELISSTERFVAIPIQMKASSKEAFSIDEKYQKTRNLLIAYVWGVRVPELTATYVLTHEEAMNIAREMNWRFTAGQFTTSSPSKKLRKLLDFHKINNPEQWWDKIQKVSASAH